MRFRTVTTYPTCFATNLTEIRIFRYFFVNHQNNPMEFDQNQCNFLLISWYFQFDLCQAQRITI